MRSNGARRGTRKLYSKKKRGMPNISTITVKHKVGDKVEIVTDSAIVKGMPHYKYHGKTATVYNINPNSYGVYLHKDVGHKKIIRYLNVRNEHLRPSRSTEQAEKVKEAIENGTYKKPEVLGPRKAISIPKANNEPVFISYKPVVTRY